MAVVTGAFAGIGRATAAPLHDAATTLRCLRALTQGLTAPGAILEVRRDALFIQSEDLARNIRPVGRAYKKLIDEWRDVLPTQSTCLTVPLSGTDGA